MDHFRYQKCKNKQLNNTQVLKVKNSTLELENDLIWINQQRREYLQNTLGFIGMIG